MNFYDILHCDIFFTSILIFLVTLVLIYLFKHDRKLPPGPMGLPIVGYLPFLTRRPYLKFVELRQKFGPIFRLRIGSKNIIVLSDYQSIKDAFTQDAFIGTPTDGPFDIGEETLKLGAVNGIRWKEQRRFIIHMLRDIGFFKEKMDLHMREEINELLDRLKEMINEPIKISAFLTPSLSNNISSLIFGKRRHFDHPKRKMLDNLLSQLGTAVGETAWQSFFPWLQYFFEFLGFRKKLSLLNQSLRNYVNDEIEEHESVLSEDNIKDFIDGYLLEIRKRKNEINTTFIKPVLVDVVKALFGAGSETPKITLDWLILVTSVNMDIQNAVHLEIDKIIGHDRFPDRSDRKQMPYTEAAVLEALRWRPVLPINLLRFTLTDAVLGKYVIPKNYYVMANFWGALHDRNLWGNDVDEFKPERFLSEDKTSVEKPDFFIPFSIGKRQCPGEPLAYVEIFLYYVSILQKFQIKCEDLNPRLEGQYRFALETYPYRIKLTLRNTL